MGYIFRVLAKELFSLSTLFLVIVPFILMNKDDYAAQTHLANIKYHTQSSIISTFEGAKNNYAFAAPNMSYSAGGSSYVNGGPIHMPTR